MRWAWGGAGMVASVLAAFSLGGCAPTQTPPTMTTVDRKGPLPTWSYDVTESPSALDLSVVATFPPHTDPRMTVAEHAEIFLVGVELADGSEWREVRHVGVTWEIPECARGCRLRYRYLLRDAATALRDVAVARGVKGVVEAPPSTWLLRPEHAPIGTTIRFRVTPAPSDAFVTGVFAGSASTPASPYYEAHSSEELQLPYSAFGNLRVHELADGAATLAILPGAIPEADVVAWANGALAAVKGFYGRLTVPHVLILVHPSNGDEVGSGSTMGYSGASIVVNVGELTTKEGFARDWVLVHELVHTALPDLPYDQHWLEEGLATYVEPLARYRQAALMQSDVWGEWAHRMEKGEPEEGDKGLNQTHTWGRTYWGGALFCLAADVEIRARTHGAKSLEDVLRAVLAAGGNIATSWPVERWIELGDKTTGTTVLHETYDKLAVHPEPVDLPALWRRLGVIPGPGNSVTFDDKAELAWVRQAMTPTR